MTDPLADQTPFDQDEFERAWERLAGTAVMDINEIVVYGGRRYVVVGFDPMSVEPARVHLKDAETGAETTRLLADLLTPLNEVTRRDEPEPAADGGQDAPPRIFPR
ncbi:MAG TPA: hypothetical protein VEH52_07025 [Gaiellaceae bacterium]|nr:hypothetical protein [Gaiellaceae bacterium]